MNLKKHILTFALAAVAVSSPAYANVDYGQALKPDFESLLKTPEVTYKKDVVSISGWKDNWFIGINGGANSFLGNPLGCEDLWGRIQPNFGAYLGKWITPKVGARVTFSGFKIKNGDLNTQDYWGAHADMMWNLLSTESRFGLVPFVGVGLLHNSDSGASPFALNYGVMGHFSLTSRIKLTLELSNATTFNNFDGLGSASFGGDNLMSLSAGLSFTIGRSGFRKVADAKPILVDNARLRALANSLYNNNESLRRQASRDDRVIAEMKKILEIEGLLSKYGNRFAALTGDDNFGNGVNDYSGLNSLRARLNGHHDGFGSETGDAHSNKNGKNSKKKLNDKIQDGDTTGNNLDSLSVDDFGKNLADGIDQSISSGDNLSDEDYLALIASGKVCIGSPIMFFFKIGTTDLTDPSQLANLDEIARVANQYDLAVKISGAADSATGNEDINSNLGENRASYINRELQKRGVNPLSISTYNDGGIDLLNPIEANRHTRIELLFKN